MPSLTISPEVQYLLLVVGLFIVPRILQRFRLPSAITCLGIGALAGMGLHVFHDDATVPFLATLGIVSLFLFAGLEVDFRELRQGLKVVIGHLAIQTLVLIGATFASMRVFHLELRAGVIFALAVLTPSTGFILDSLAGFGLGKEQEYWVRTKAISSEIIALAVLFVAIQSSSVEKFSVSAAALAAMILVLPWLFKTFAKFVLPYAPKSEFTFLMILAAICAYVTRQLGVYYLVGAFVVGITAVRLKKRLPALGAEKLIGGVELFASFFIPFYFFKAGLHLEAADFSWQALWIGLALVAVAVPLRVGIVVLHRRLAVHETAKDSFRVSLSLVPTFVFTIVLAGILREKFQLDGSVFGGLMVFTIINTMLPGLILRAPPPDFDSPEAPRLREDLAVEFTIDDHTAP